jgi:hypothetical protein
MTQGKDNRRIVAQQHENNQACRVFTFTKSVDFSPAPKGDIYDDLAEWLRNDAPESAKNAVLLMREVVKEQDQKNRSTTLLQFRKTVGLMTKKADHE